MIGADHSNRIKDKYYLIFCTVCKPLIHCNDRFCTDSKIVLVYTKQLEVTQLAKSLSSVAVL